MIVDHGDCYKKNNKKKLEISKQDEEKKTAVVFLYYKPHFSSTSMAQPLYYLVKKPWLLWCSVQEGQAVKAARRK